MNNNLRSRWAVPTPALASHVKPAQSHVDGPEPDTTSLMVRAGDHGVGCRDEGECTVGEEPDEGRDRVSRVPVEVVGEESDSRQQQQHPRGVQLVESQHLPHQESSEHDNRHRGRRMEEPVLSRSLSVHGYCTEMSALGSIRSTAVGFATCHPAVAGESEVSGQSAPRFVRGAESLRGGFMKRPRGRRTELA